METLVLVLVILALVCFLLAAAGAWYPRWHAGWLGLALLTLALLLSNTVFGVNV